MARFYLRPLYDVIQAAPHQYGQVRLSPPGQIALRWWRDLARTVTVPPHDGRALWQTPRTLTIHTDAATDYLTQAAWGGVLRKERDVRIGATASKMADSAVVVRVRARSSNVLVWSLANSAAVKTPRTVSWSGRLQLSTPPQAACVR